MGDTEESSIIVASPEILPIGDDAIESLNRELGHFQAFSYVKIAARAVPTSHVTECRSKRRVVTIQEFLRSLKVEIHVQFEMEKGQVEYWKAEVSVLLRKRGCVERTIITNKILGIGRSVRECVQNEVQGRIDGSV